MYQLHLHLFQKIEKSRFLNFKTKFNDKSLNRMGLHARELEFISLLGKKIRVIAKYDKKFKNLIKFASSN